MNFSIEARSIKRLMAWRTAGSLNSGCLVLMLARSPSTSTAGSVYVEHDELDSAGLDNAHLPLPALSSLSRDFVLHQHVIAIIIFAGLQHRARRRQPRRRRP